MRLVTLRTGEQRHAGVVVDDRILDLVQLGSTIPEVRDLPGSVRGILNMGNAGLDVIRRAIETMRTEQDARGASVDFANAKLDAPIPDPGLILACGHNYRAHLEEMATPAPSRPASFLKSVNTVIGPYDTVQLPARHAAMVDWEAEFAIVIGHACHNVTESDAMNYVAGYTLINDVSARDWAGSVRRATDVRAAVNGWQDNIFGKQFPTFCPMGPVMVTCDEIAADNVDLTTTVNGELMQSANTADLIFNVTWLIWYFSQYYNFRPGDIITTGSPSGVGFARNPPIFLKAGDRVEVAASGIGKISNLVAGPQKN